MASWEERAGRNEALFREVNYNIARAEATMDSVSDSLSALCECALIDCTTHIEIPLRDYAAARQHEHRFIVTPGHEQPEIERVVERTRDYVVVEKEGAAAVAADDAS